MPNVIASLTKVAVVLEGLPPGLLFQGKGLMALEGNESKTKKKRTPAEEARLRAHWMGNGKSKQLCIPWTMFYRSLCDAAGQFKYRGNKKMTAIVAGSVACEEDRIPLGKKYDVLEEYARIPPRTGAMVLIGRPLVKQWKASFTLIVDDELYDASQLEQIFVHAGKMIGIGAWRPALKGPYGRFVVTKFDVQ